MKHLFTHKDWPVILLLTLFLAWWSDPSRADGLRTAGDIFQIALPTIGLGMSLNEPTNKGTVQWLESFVTTTVVTQTLKYSINRERPNGGDLSFPSGHTSSAFQGAAFIYKRYGEQYGIPAYLLASMVGYSRVHAGVHYWSDVVVGAAIGIAASYYWTSEQDLKKGQMLVPYVDSVSRTYGLTWIKTF